MNQIEYTSGTEEKLSPGNIVQMKNGDAYIVTENNSLVSLKTGDFYNKGCYYNMNDVEDLDSVWYNVKIIIE